MERKNKEGVEQQVLELNMDGVTCDYELIYNRVIEYNKNDMRNFVGTPTSFEEYNRDPIAYTRHCLSSGMSVDNNEIADGNNPLLVEYGNEFIAPFTEGTKVDNKGYLIKGEE